MKFRVDLTIKGYVEIDADSAEEARLHIEDGYSLSNVIFEDDEIDEISEIQQQGQ